MAHFTFQGFTILYPLTFKLIQSKSQLSHLQNFKAVAFAYYRLTWGRLIWGGWEKEHVQYA